LYLLNAVQRQPQQYQKSLVLRQDVKRLRTIIGQLTFLSKNHINSMTELNAYRRQAKAQTTALYKERALLYRRLEKVPQEGRAGLQSNLSTLNDRISQARKEMNLCQTIITRQRNRTQNQSKARAPTRTAERSKMT